jgi:hypothetical protein
MIHTIIFDDVYSHEDKNSFSFLSKTSFVKKLKKTVPLLVLCQQRAGKKNTKKHINIGAERL